MLRVDVPATSTQPSFTRFYSASAVYAIHPVDEGTATIMAGKLQVAPITIWDMRDILKKSPKQLEEGAAELDFDINEYKNAF